MIFIFNCSFISVNKKNCSTLNFSTRRRKTLLKMNTIRSNDLRVKCVEFVKLYTVPGIYMHEVRNRL